MALPAGAGVFILDRARRFRSGKYYTKQALFTERWTLEQCPSYGGLASL